jgi:hypothetical protein
MAELMAEETQLGNYPNITRYLVDMDAVDGAAASKGEFAAIFGMLRAK